MLRLSRPECKWVVFKGLPRKNGSGCVTRNFISSPVKNQLATQQSPEPADCIVCPTSLEEMRYSETGAALISIRLLVPIVAWPWISALGTCWPFCDKLWRAAAGDWSAFNLAPTTISFA